MNAARTGHAATLLTTGQVLAAAGENNTQLTSAELYNPATRTWTTTGSLHATRVQHTATLLQNGQVLVAGGQNGSTFLASTERYNPSTGAWTTTGSLHTARLYHTTTLLQNGQVLCCRTGRCSSPADWIATTTTSPAPNCTHPSTPASGAPRSLAEPGEPDAVRERRLRGQVRRCVGVDLRQRISGWPCAPDVPAPAQQAACALPCCNEEDMFT